MDQWIRVDEDDDVIASLRHVLLCKTHIAADPLTWKWYALALHSAIQGACVCHLVTTTTPMGAVTRKNAAEWANYSEELRSNPEAKSPRTYLMEFPELLKAIRKPNSAGDGRTGSEIQLSDSDLNWLQRFHDEIRNQFTHFEPRAWSLEVSGLPGLASTGCRIISDIAAGGWAFRHKDAAWHCELRSVVGQIVTSD